MHLFRLDDCSFDSEKKKKRRKFQSSFPSSVAADMTKRILRWYFQHGWAWNLTSEEHSAPGLPPTPSRLPSSHSLRCLNWSPFSTSPHPTPSPAPLLSPSQGSSRHPSVNTTTRFIVRHALTHCAGMLDKLHVSLKWSWATVFLFLFYFLRRRNRFVLFLLLLPPLSLPLIIIILAVVLIVVVFVVALL